MVYLLETFSIHNTSGSGRNIVTGTPKTEEGDGWSWLLQNRNFLHYPLSSASAASPGSYLHRCSGLPPHGLDLPGCSFSLPGGSISGGGNPGARQGLSLWLLLLLLSPFVQGGNLFPSRQNQRTISRSRVSQCSWETQTEVPPALTTKLEHTWSFQSKTTTGWRSVCHVTLTFFSID